MNNAITVIAFDILQQLNTAKLDYLKAADLQMDTNKKRMFNMQGLLRNRYFQELLAYLRSNDVDTQAFVLRNIRIDQRMVTALNGKAADQTMRCVEADRELVKAYKLLLVKLPEVELFHQQLQAIETVLPNVMASHSKSLTKGTIFL